MSDDQRLPSGDHWRCGSWYLMEAVPAFLYKRNVLFYGQLLISIKVNMLYHDVSRGFVWMLRLRAPILQGRHNERDGVSNHRRLDCLLNRLFRHRWKKTSKLCVTGLCVGNSPVTGEFPSQRPVTRKMFSFDVIMDLSDSSLSLNSLRPNNVIWRHISQHWLR